MEGALEYEEAADAVSECMDEFAEVAETLPEATGTLVLRIDVAAEGTVSGVAFSTDTLVPRPWSCVPGESDEIVGGDAVSAEAAARQRIKRAAKEIFSGHIYPAKTSRSVVMMPLIFE
ncbi:MAG: hypothetical protein HC767_02335 [Akkermansiaceae bacterium]|nr:hypothetical protein [Akkermansiaceae bacterium]